MKSRRDIVLFSLGLPILLLSWVGFNYFSRDELDTQLRALAGPNATDCGAMGRGVVDAAIVQNCAVQAFDKKQPFFYRAALTPVPNRPERSLGTVMTPKNEMFLLSAQEPAWDNWLGRVTGKVQLFNPHLALAANGTPTISFNRAPKPKAAKPNLNAVPQKPQPSAAIKPQSSSKP